MTHQWKNAYKTLLHNKKRTFLTALGIIIGIAVVVMVLAAGEGFKSYINAQIAQFGSNTITVETQIPPTTRDREQNKGGKQSGSGAVQIKTLTTRDVLDIKRLPGVKNAYGVVMSQQRVAYGGVIVNSFVLGADAARFEIDGGVIAKGRPYTEAEDRALDQVAVLGSEVAANLFGDADPLDEVIRIGTMNFTVVGVYAPRGSMDPVANTDKQVIVPLGTLQKKLLGINHLFYALVEFAPTASPKIVALDIADLLRKNHNIDDPAKDDFKVATQEENLSTFNTILSATQFLLLAIALISLIVGGVGVMNIMYVVVSERTPEIGLKKALGATNADILQEFLIEAIVLTLFGGVLGVLFGGVFSYLIALLARTFGFTWVFRVPIFGVIVALAVSATIGLVFGVFPAKNASKLDPIEALRVE